MGRLGLLGVDGVVRRTPDTPENRAPYNFFSDRHGDTGFPQGAHGLPNQIDQPHADRQCVQWLSQQLNEASETTDRPPPRISSLTLSDRGFYSLGLLHKWQPTGAERHWLMPLKKGTQYEVVPRWGSQDAVVLLSTSPQASKQWPGLPEHLTAQLISKTIKDKVCQILSVRWPTRCAFRDPTKKSLQTCTASDGRSNKGGWRVLNQKKLLNSSYTLRSKTPEMIEQELWGVLLGYNWLFSLSDTVEIRPVHCTGVYQCEMSFSAAVPGRF